MSLSGRIDRGEIEDIQGAFLSDLHLVDISFDGPDGVIRPSVRDISTFRLIE